MYKCPKCELNYVKEEGALCEVCAQTEKKMLRTDGVFKPYIDYKNTCYGCLTKLDSKFDKFCPRCGWLICHNCGSCNCMKL